MKTELVPVQASRKHALENLLEKYDYEFSQYDRIPFDEEGLFHYQYLDDYFTDPNRYAYFIYADGRLAGFVMVRKRPECPRAADWSVAEFFVAYSYRRQGVATAAMESLFQHFKGVWQIKYHPKNLPSVAFWNKIAQTVSGGAYETVPGDEDYYDGTPSVVLVFRA